MGGTAPTPAKLHPPPPPGARNAVRGDATSAGEVPGANTTPADYRTPSGNSTDTLRTPAADLAPSFATARRTDARSHYGVGAGGWRWRLW